jgi:hypothetical protein
MDLILFLVIPGFFGGLVMALLILKRQRKSEKRAVAEVGDDRISSDINISRIRVAGIGGLGLVAMAIVVALNVPRIGQSLAAGLLLGMLFGAILILRRRRAGPVASSGRRPGANTVLSIDDPAPTSDNEEQESPRGRLSGLKAQVNLEHSCKDIP